MKSDRIRQAIALLADMKARNDSSRRFDVQLASDIAKLQLYIDSPPKWETYTVAIEEPNWQAGICKDPRSLRGDI